MQLIREPKDRIIFPLDFPDYNSAKKYVEILKGHIGLFKIGLELFVKEGPEILKLVLHRAGIAKSAGCAGVVCSGLEASFVRKEFGNDFIIVTPGIRPSWSVIKNDDQQRIVTPSDAIKAGADYIVVGRTIRTAKDPMAAVKKIAEEIENTLE